MAGRTTTTAAFRRTICICERDGERPGKGSSAKGVVSEVIAAGAETECGISGGGSVGGEGGGRGGAISVRRDPQPHLRDLSSSCLIHCLPPNTNKS